MELVLACRLPLAYLAYQNRLAYRLDSYQGRSLLRLQRLALRHCPTLGYFDRLRRLDRPVVLLGLDCPFFIPFLIAYRRNCTFIDNEVNPVMVNTIC